VRISELAHRSKVPLPTVKYYLREGLLAPGTTTRPNQADYGDEHVRRLRLIRVLREIGRLDVGRIREIVNAIDDGRLSRHALFGTAARALASERGPADFAPEMERAREDVDQLIGELGWNVRGDAVGRRQLAESLAALRRLGRDVGPEVFRRYAAAADEMAGWELASIDPELPRAAAIERMVVGTVVFEAVFNALRRLAHEHRSAGSG
jgi:DNA-binding transcriptional MerR regulator